MVVDRSKLYDDVASFFVPSGNVIMQLSARAAVEVCVSAADRGFSIACVEGQSTKRADLPPMECASGTGQKRSAILKALEKTTKEPPSSFGITATTTARS